MHRSETSGWLHGKRSAVLTWLAGLAALTAGLFAFRDVLDKAHVALVYLVLVLAGSSQRGRSVGLGLAVGAFLSFNFFFIPPYHTFAIADPMDWLVLVAFLITAIVAAQLLSRATSEAEDAKARTQEVDRLSSLGAETLNVARAEDGLNAIVKVIRTTLELSRVDIFLRNDSGEGIRRVASDGEEEKPPLESPTYGGMPLLEWVAANGKPALVRVDGGTRVESAHEGTVDRLVVDHARELLLPLHVRERSVGVLCLKHASVISLDRSQRRFLDALAYYAALGVDRVQLTAAAERASALREADELKNALLASVSHDIRTPLTTIKALAHEIRVEGDDRAATIEEEADRLNRFVADLLDLSRLSAGALRLTIEINSADDLLGAAIQRVSGSLNGRTLDASIAPDDPMLFGRFDFVHSLRALVNLIENALKYSPPESIVELSARRRNGILEVAVADRGMGISPDEEGRIFEPFYQPQGTPADAAGAGLGLAIARQLARAQGGDVSCKRRDGGGSIFTLSLPSADISELAVEPVEPVLEADSL